MTARSKRLLAQTLVFLFMSYFPASAGHAQKSGEPGSRIRVTGCLQKGTEPDVFSLAGDHGKHYELVSTSVQLSEHVGHKVTVAGTFIGKEDEENEGREEDEGWAGKIRVSNLKMIADRCK